MFDFCVHLSTEVLETVTSYVPEKLTLSAELVWPLKSIPFQLHRNAVPISVLAVNCTGTELLHTDTGPEGEILDVGVGFTVTFTFELHEPLQLSVIRQVKL